MDQEEIQAVVLLLLSMAVLLIPYVRRVVRSCSETSGIYGSMKGRYNYET